MHFLVTSKLSQILNSNHCFGIKDLEIFSFDTLAKQNILAFADGLIFNFLPSFENFAEYSSQRLLYGSLSEE